jgi:hypothetical protein
MNRVDKKVKNCVAVNDIERVVRKVDSVAPAGRVNLEFHVFYVRISSVSRRFINSVLRRIGADDLTRDNGIRNTHRYRAGAASKIQYFQTGVDVRKQFWCRFFNRTGLKATHKRRS